MWERGREHHGGRERGCREQGLDGWLAGCGDQPRPGPCGIQAGDHQTQQAPQLDQFQAAPPRPLWAVGVVQEGSVTGGHEGPAYVAAPAPAAGSPPACPIHHPTTHKTLPRAHPPTMTRLASPRSRSLPAYHSARPVRFLTLSSRAMLWEGVGSREGEEADQGAVSVLLGPGTSAAACSRHGPAAAVGSARSMQPSAAPPWRRT